MLWSNKRDKRRKAIESALHQGSQPPVGAAILDGDEDALTPVEDRLLGKLARLQSFSPIAIRLLHLFDRDDIDVNEIVRLVQSDAALAAETLAYVNSAIA